MSPTCPEVELIGRPDKKMPMIGLGTWQSSDDQVTAAVKAALDAGYRHIDCAWMYGNEAAVGKGIRQWIEETNKGHATPIVSREDIWVTSKVWCKFLNAAEECIDSSLERLGIGYLDLVLVHWPMHLNPKGEGLIPRLPDGTRDIVKGWKISEVWSQLEALVKKEEGKPDTRKVRSIGVSNCGENKLREILETATVVPAVNQLELHVYNPDHALLAYMKSQGIQPQAYSPLGGTPSKDPNVPVLIKDEVIAGIAAKYNADIPTVLLRYLLQNGITILPKSVTPSRIVDNFVKPLSIELSAEDMKTLDSLAASGKQWRFIRPDWPVDEIKSAGLANYL